MKPTQRPLGPWDSRTPARRSRHGLTADEIDALIALQGGCAVCHRTDRPLEIDHDHKHCPGPVGCRQCACGAVCYRCNKVIYLVEDSPSIARSLLAYLERTRPDNR